MLGRDGFMTSSPEGTRERAVGRREQTRAKRLPGRVARRAWWCECRNVPLNASRRVRKCRRAPCRFRRCGESGVDWLGGLCSAGDDGEIESAVLQRSWGDRADGL